MRWCLNRRMNQPTISCAARLSLALVALLACLGALVVAPSGAHAAFPGLDGRIAYAGSVGSENGLGIFTILPDGSQRQRLTPNTYLDEDPSWSANGQTLVFSRTSTGSTYEIITMAADGSRQTTVAKIRGETPSPSFSPSGNRIVFTDGYKIFSVRAKGGKRRMLLSATRSGPGISQPRYSPDGKLITFAGVPRGNASNHGIWTMRSNGRRLKRITKGETDADPDFKPSGNRILYRHGDRIRIMRLDGSRVGTPHGIPADSFGAVFSPSGRSIAAERAIFIETTAWCSDLFTIGTTASEPVFLTDNCQQSFPRGKVVSPSWQPVTVP